MSETVTIEASTGEVVPAERQMRGEVLRREDVQVTTADALELANELRAVVTDRKWYSVIQGRDYLNVEAWTFIGGRLGLTAKTSATPFMHPKTGEWIGYNGHASIYDRRMGEVVAEADHSCLFEEPTRKWPVNHCVGMAQTRSVSRAYQEQFRWIAQLAGYEGTPAEEMSGVGESAPPRSTPATRAKAAAAAPTLAGEPPWFVEQLGFGKFKATIWRDMCAGTIGGNRHSYLEYLRDGINKDTKDGKPLTEKRRDLLERVAHCLTEISNRADRIEAGQGSGDAVPF